MGLELEKRRYPRAAVNWPVTMLTASGPIEGEVKNISPGGAFITCSAQPGLNETFRLVIKVPFERQYLLATGRVARSSLYAPDDRVLLRGVAIRFTEISEDDRNLLNQMVAGRGRFRGARD
ncbi:MAG TPA: PilZ domain-containing protein [Syntrophobacteria bacterium]|nr:PilZ domain-containing protein [Syntrophobacteria bacterium]